MCSASGVSYLLSVCLGFVVRRTSCQRTPNLGRIAQASLVASGDRDLVRYLLLRSDFTLSQETNVGPRNEKSIQIPLSLVQRKRIYEIIIDYLLTETSIIVRELSSSDLPSAQSTSADMMQVLITLAAINHEMVAYTGVGGSPKAKDLRKVVDQLMEMVVKRILYQDSRGDLMDGVYESLASFPPCKSCSQDDQHLLLSGLTGIAQHFGPDFQRDLKSRTTPNGVQADNVIDLEMEFESQGSHHRGTDEDSSTKISHDVTTAATDRMAFQASQAAKLALTSQASYLSESENMAAFVDYLISLQPHEFLACRSLMNDVFQSNVQMSEEDAGSLLKYLGQEILAEDEFERCEVSMGVCLDIMTHFVEMWTSSEPSEITDTHGPSLYEWFIKLALERGISSSHVYVCLSSMLRRVIKIRPEYARSLSLPSARTSLFKVLNEASLLVKYIIGSEISEIFGLFVLKEHDSILTDIIDNLPNKVDWPEGLAVRLFVLARLGAAWSTLLRQCIFRLFETPGHIPASTGHARLCLDFVSRNLGLHDTQELFRLFVPQIMYTWLETQTIDTIPYSIFGYGSIAELLIDTQSEVVGQMVMRGKDNEAAKVAFETETSYQRLLEMSFSKVSAYCVARDIAIPSSQSAHAPGAEARLRKTIGKDQYASLVTLNFANILVVFYKSLDQEDYVARAFQKYPDMKNVAAAYEAMTKISASDKAVPPNQQPSFKANFLIDEVQHLCSRTSYEFEKMWSPALFVMVFRGLINTIHPALGSLHACSVLRRMRILICMAGPTALASYPLEMILHSLRPFLTDPQCSDDAIGMFQYLLDEGTPYLKEVPRFLAGIATSTLISMRAFLGSTQESTTQESEHQATMSKAQAFHTWFANYLDMYTSTELTDVAEGSFKAIVRASRNVQARGNARKGTYESDLLIEILEDERSGRNLLNRPSRNLILDLLCTSFEYPPNFRDDIAGSDEQATKFANVVWNASLRGICGHNFLLWAARVIGRAFATSGSIDCVNIHDETTALSRNEDLLSSESPASRSKSRILRSLSNFLLVDNRAEVGMAEKTLRSIVNNAKRTDDIVECEQLLPHPLMKSMAWTHYELTIEGPGKPAPVSLAESAEFDEQKTPSIWLEQFCVALAVAAGPDTVLSELPDILTTVKALPGQIFPYVLHLALLHEAGASEKIRHIISKAFREWFKICGVHTLSHVRVLLEALLYIRKQPLPNEASKSDRSRWLDIDYKEASRAAAACSMYKAALMFLEIDFSEAAKASRRSSANRTEERTELGSELLLNIYEQIDEQDSIYGVQQSSNLSALMKRLEYEQAGFKSLSFRGAHYDSQIRQSNESRHTDEESMIKILNTLDLHGLSQSLLSKVTDAEPSSVDSMLSTARKLEQWDIFVPTSHKTAASSIFKALQGIHNAPDKKSLTSILEAGLSDTMELLLAHKDATLSTSENLRALAVLTEVDEAFSSNSIEQLHEVSTRFQARTRWMDNDR